MIIEPKVREYICTTAHPQGCAESVRNQADYACKQGMVNGTKKALIIGCSTGYGLASRICALENCGADTLGIMFERQANGRRTATPGWYSFTDWLPGKVFMQRPLTEMLFQRKSRRRRLN